MADMTNQPRYWLTLQKRDDDGEWHRVSESPLREDQLHPIGLLLYELSGYGLMDVKAFSELSPEAQVRWVKNFAAGKSTGDGLD